MTGTGGDKIVARVFSRAFEKMCNFVAVARIGDPNETIRGLIQLCFYEFPDDRYDSAKPIRDTIETLFGLAIPETQVEPILNELESSGVLVQPGGSHYTLSATARRDLKDRIAATVALEQRVQQAWYVELERDYPNVPTDTAWTALRAYLARAFRRHGIQAAALLDPTVDTPIEHEPSLSVILDSVIEETVKDGRRGEIRAAVGGFMAEVGTDADRTQYIAQLADGAFNFYTLEVPADLAEKLREQLYELTLFLDTNFLFGILDLHYNSQVEISHQLLRAVAEHKLPFKLRFHAKTFEETRATIAHYAALLRSREWSRSLSRAASRSRNLAGIEQKFHERNGTMLIDVDEFLRPYEHFDHLLKGKDIKIYRPHEEREQARIDLFHDYDAYLKSKGRSDKAYETVMHDATVLEEVRHLRTNTKSSLQAGALLVTCDYNLYRYDWDSSRRDGRLACVLLPNIFWQMLRPFIPTDEDFEKAFAETFALPEFRALGSGGSKACSKMIQILATYRDVPEETAFKMLSNDLLLDNLRTVETDEAFEEQVEAAFVAENRNLLEEKAALQKELERRDKERDRLKQQLEGTAQELASAQDSITVVKSRADQAVDVGRSAEEHAKQLIVEGATAKRHAKVMAIIAGIAVGAILVGAFECCIHLIPWAWMKNHPNSLSLQLGLAAALFLASIGSFVSSWRKWCWGTGIVAILIALLSLVNRGGSGPTP